MPAVKLFDYFIEPHAQIDQHSFVTEYELQIFDSLNSFNQSKVIEVCVRYWIIYYFNPHAGLKSE